MSDRPWSSEGSPWSDSERRVRAPQTRREERPYWSVARQTKMDYLDLIVEDWDELVGGKS